MMIMMTPRTTSIDSSRPGLRASSVTSVLLRRGNPTTIGRPVMSLTALGVTAITDFVLAGEALFLAGLLVARPKQRWSAVWYWQGVLLMLALGAFIGGVDHGFFQIAGETHVRKMVQHTTWVVLGVLTAATVMTV